MNNQLSSLDLNQYRGQWVALDPDTRAVVSHDPSLEKAEREAVQRGVSSPLLLPVSESDGFFVGMM
jgi:hypothetical protein